MYNTRGLFCFFLKNPITPPRTSEPNSEFWCWGNFVAEMFFGKRQKKVTNKIKQNSQCVNYAWTVGTWIAKKQWLRFVFQLVLVFQVAQNISNMFFSSSSSTRIISHGQNLETYIQAYRWYRYCKLAQHILFPPLKSLTIDTKWNYKKCDCVQASGINREKCQICVYCAMVANFHFFVQLCPPW